MTKILIHKVFKDKSGEKPHEIIIDQNTLNSILEDVKSDKRAMDALCKAKTIIDNSVTSKEKSSPDVHDIYRPIYNIIAKYNKYYPSAAGREIISFLNENALEGIRK